LGIFLEFLEFLDLLEPSAPEKTLLRQKYSRPGRVNTPKAAIFLATKSKPS
jgi:hypothetical protein